MESPLTRLEIVLSLRVTSVFRYAFRVVERRLNWATPTYTLDGEIAVLTFTVSPTLSIASIEYIVLQEMDRFGLGAKILEVREHHAKIDLSGGHAPGT